MLTCTRTANDVMAAMDLIYLSLLTNRIPIVPPFWPTHVGTDAGLVPFSDFFDVTRWAKTLNIPILEWKDVKNFASEKLDPEKYFNTGYYGGGEEGIGCWSVWMTQHARGEGPREGEVPAALSLDISWTPVRFGHQIDPTAEEYDLLALAKLAEPQEREVAMREAKNDYLTEMWRTIGEAKEKGNNVPDDPPRKIPLPNRKEEQLDPDDHLLCYDYLYFTSTHEVSAPFCISASFSSTLLFLSPSLFVSGLAFLRSFHIFPPTHQSPISPSYFIPSPLAHRIVSILSPFPPPPHPLSQLIPPY
jgi:hypothetical protein